MQFASVRVGCKSVASVRHFSCRLLAASRLPLSFQEVSARRAFILGSSGHAGTRPTARAYSTDSAYDPVVAVTLGDPAGIGAELIARLLEKRDPVSLGNVVIVGDPWLWEAGQKVAKVQVPIEQVSSFAEVRSRRDRTCPAFLTVSSVAEPEVSIGTPSASGGRSVLQILNLCMDAAKTGEVDAICFAPLNKQAMKMGGMAHEDELHHFAEYLGVTGYFCEFNTLGNVWTSRLSSHVPMNDIFPLITQPRILQASELIYKSLLESGVEQPKIAIAALNPHGGEGGTCGREEIDIIEPAVRALQAREWPTENPFHGPFPADTIFLKVQEGDFQGVVTMYHDQGQIAIKLMGFKNGVTVQGGLPIPICTPAHGTAYDIAGDGRASVDATLHAFKVAAQMGRRQRSKRVSE